MLQDIDQEIVFNQIQDIIEKVQANPINPGEYMAPRTLEKDIFKQAMKEISEDPLSFIL